MAKSNKTFPKTHALSKLAIAIFCANSGLAVSAPELNNISTGNADISGLGTDVTIIDQTVASATPVVTIDWATFNVGENQTVNFVQNSSDIAINNIGTGGASQILGKINADGTVFLQNTNGFVFGANSIINTGAFLATTSTISLDSADTISLEETNTGGSIEINQGASISANNQASGGYLAFISNNISIGSNAGLVSDDSGLSANQGEVLISSDVNSNIKLSGLNINFPASSLTESNKTDNVAEIDITNANISATSVILSSDNLTDLLNSVINQPVSISSDHLILSGKALGGTDTYSITQGIKEAVDTYSEVNSDLNFSELTLEDRSDSGNIEFTTNISIKDEIDLNLRSNTISFNGGNIAGSDSNLTLNASNIEIGYFQNNFGGSSGLGSLTLNGGFSSNNNGIIIKGSINTKNDIIMNGDVTILRDNADHADSDGIIKTSFRSEFGQLSINDSLNFDAGTSAQTGKLYIRTGGDLGISLGETKGFSEIDLNAGRVSLNGDLTATNSISINNIDTRTNIEINNPVNSSLNLSANNISFEDFIFSSSTSGDLNFNVTGDGSVSLKNSHASEETPITSVNIQNIGTDNETDVIISGDFNTTNFSVGSETTSNTFSLSLAGDSSFTNISKFDLSQAEIIDSNYQLSLEGITSENSTASASASFSTVSLNGLGLTNFLDVTLNEDITTKENGLYIQSDNIYLGEGIGMGTKNIALYNQNGGAITLDSTITSRTLSNPTSLTIDTFSSDIKLGSINNINQLLIKQELAGQSTTELNGDISTYESITFQDAGDIIAHKDIALTTTLANSDSSISLINSKLTGGNDDTYIDINLTSQNIIIDQVTGNNIDINTRNLTLSGDITALGELNLLSEDANTNTEVTLTNDILLTGNIDFLSESNNRVNFKRVGASTSDNKDLSIIASNEYIKMHTFDDQSELNSLTITTASIDNLIEVSFNTDADGAIILPTLTGSQGLSLLGNMMLDVGENYTFDTSGYGGNLNFSGVSITGSGELGFNTGTGELSLGDIGTNNPDDLLFTNLKIGSTGKLNLHGDLNIALEDGKSFDFSSLNTIELHTDLTLGNSETLVGVNFGSASINGTHDLTLYTNNLTLGEIGNNIALQDLNIFNTSEDTLELDNNISVVGDIKITSSSLILDNVISNTGLDVKINTEGDLIMSNESIINASSNNISLISNTGNIGIGKLIAAKDVTVRSEQGYLYNSIDNYISNDSTDINISSENQYLYGLTTIGKSVASPIVIDAQNGGTIYAESNGSIYIANLANAKVNATGRVIDGSIGGETATLDAFTQFKLSSLNTTNLPTLSSNLGLISNSTWQVDEEESIRKIKSPVSAPSIYYSRNGWRLGQK